jgi:hypothetical protein
MPGIWFKSAWRFKCKSCKSTVPLTYSNKLALFSRHREPVQRAEAAPDGGEERIESPAAQLANLGVNKSQPCRSGSAVRRDDIRVAKTPPRIIFGDKRFQKGLI